MVTTRLKDDLIIGGDRNGVQRSHGGAVVLYLGRMHLHRNGIRCESGQRNGFAAVVHQGEVTCAHRLSRGRCMDTRIDQMQARQGVPFCCSLVIRCLASAAAGLFG